MDDGAGRGVGLLAGVDGPGLEPVCSRFALFDVTHGRPATSVPDAEAAASEARASKYDRMSVRVRTRQWHGRPTGPQRGRRLQHLHGPFDRLAHPDRGELWGPSHAVDRHVEHFGVERDRLHQVEFVDRPRHLGVGERRRVLAHRGAG